MFRKATQIACVVLCATACFASESIADAQAAAAAKDWPKVAKALTTSATGFDANKVVLEGDRLVASLNLLEALATTKAADASVAEAYDKLFMAAIKGPMLVENKPALTSARVQTMAIGFYDGSSARKTLTEKKYKEYRTAKLEYTADILAEIKRGMVEAGSPATPKNPPVTGWGSSIEDPTRFRFLAFIRGTFRSQFEGTISSMYQSGQLDREAIAKFTRRAMYSGDESDGLKQLLDHADAAAEKTQK